MDLQLKNVHFSERLSEETNAFTADIYFRGNKVGYAKNDGGGGETDINAHQNMREAFNEAISYAKSLPQIQTDFTHGIGGKKFTFDSDLEAQVDDLFEKWLKNKELTKASNKGVLYTSPDGKDYVSKWRNFTIAKLLKHPKGEAMIRQEVLRLQSAGNIILNTNLGSILN